MAGETLLEAQGLVKSFAGQPVLKGISLTVRRGEFLTLLGPSGCGKTTTLRLIAGFEEPDSGRILLSGRDVTSDPPYRRDIHTVFQHYALFPHLTVADNIAFGLKLRRLPEREIKTRVSEALALVKLPGFETRRIQQLSGGQMQRIAVARALVGRPALLLLDEPLGALDLKLRRAMQLELKSIQRTLGLAFVYVTHDQEEAMTMSDRIAVFQQGEIVQLGTPEEIYERPRTSYIADFIGSANILSAEVGETSGGRVQLRIEGRIPVTLPVESSTPASGKVRVAVRPERIAVLPGDGPAPAEDVVRLRGTVRTRAYLGNACQLVVSAFGGDGPDLHCLTKPTEKPPAEGADVCADIRTQDILLLEPHD